MSPKALLAALCTTAALAAAGGSVVIPTDVQLRWADYEVGAIGHFLPISNHCRNATAFDPRNVDTDSWVRAIAQFGAKYAVFVVRHACGFCLWPTNATVAETGFAYEHSIKHSIKHSPGGGVRGLVPQVRGAAGPLLRRGQQRLHGREEHQVQRDREGPGAERGPVLRARHTAAHRTVVELLRPGRVWFDGGIDEKYVVPLAGLFGRLQPDAVAFQMTHTPNGVRWAGTEDG